MAKKKTKKTMATVYEDNIIEHMRLIIDLEEQKKKHFHFDSKVWKAIRDNVAYKDDLVKHPEDHLIMSYRGTGRAVSLKHVQLYCKDYTVKPAKEHDTVGFEVEVEYIHEDDNTYENPPTITKKTTLQVPIGLLTNFTKAKFNNWVKKAKAEREAEEKERELKTLKSLMDKYPDDVATMIGS